jgi:hypothetical protein
LRVSTLSARVPAGKLREEVRDLTDTLQEHVLEKDRRAWLSAQLAALDTALGSIAGQQFGYRQLVERGHSITSRFVRIRLRRRPCQLRDALPGRGHVRERYQSTMLSRHALSARRPASRG